MKLTTVPPGNPDAVMAQTGTGKKKKNEAELWNSCFVFSL
jgi:hypothetical protein